MSSEDRRRYRALEARDARFDGLFFVGVSSTGIYCRPICPARTPRQANCKFYDSAEHAEQAGFRPCLRCRPELAPGHAPIDDRKRIAQLIIQRLQEGGLDEKLGIDLIASQFQLSSRQLRRIVQQELGVAPIQLLLTRRLLLAKQLLTETTLPVVNVAFASGFSSVRRFNDAFRGRYGLPPGRLRRQVQSGAPDTFRQSSVLQLCYRAPYDWQGIIGFLKGRALDGIEVVTEDGYARTVRWGNFSGWIRVTHAPRKQSLLLEFSPDLMPVLPLLIARVRSLFDLDARPDVVAKHLSRDPLLARAVKANPGLRVPGAFHGFELGLRAILGQQISVQAATTLACRFVQTFGEPIATPFPELHRTSPLPERIAEADVEEISAHGIVSTRARSIIALAVAQRSPELCLDGGRCVDPEAFMARLTQLPGIGTWTAHYITMRALGWSDAFPKEDVALRHRLGNVTAKEAEALAERWRPWRSYAVLHLWRMPKSHGNRARSTDIVAAPNR